MSETLDKSFEINRETYDHINPERLAFKPRPGVSEDLVREISRQKNEPEWMLRKRLEGLKRFNEMSLPDWGPSLKDLNLDEIYFFMRPDAKRNAQSWDTEISALSPSSARMEASSDTSSSLRTASSISLVAGKSRP